MTLCECYAQRKKDTASGDKGGDVELVKPIDDFEIPSEGSSRVSIQPVDDEVLHNCILT
jgi:hypothetical protein